MDLRGVVDDAVAKKVADPDGKLVVLALGISGKEITHIRVFCERDVWAMVKRKPRLMNRARVTSDSCRFFQQRAVAVAEVPRNRKACKTGSKYKPHNVSSGT